MKYISRRLHYTHYGINIHTQDVPKLVIQTYGVIKQKVENLQYDAIVMPPEMVL